jgi:hypothetical protein
MARRYYPPHRQITALANHRAPVHHPPPPPTAVLPSPARLPLRDDTGRLAIQLRLAIRRPPPGRQISLRQAVPAPSPARDTGHGRLTPCPTCHPPTASLAAQARNDSFLSPVTIVREQASSAPPVSRIRHSASRRVVQQVAMSSRAEYMLPKSAHRRGPSVRSDPPPASRHLCRLEATTPGSCHPSTDPPAPDPELA